MAQDYTMPTEGTLNITTCSGVLRDPGGTSEYPNNCNSYVTIYPEQPGCKVRIVGDYDTESPYNAWDYFYVYDGTTTSGTQLGYFYGEGTCDVTSNSGPLTIYFHSDGSVQYDGFELSISCVGGCACGAPLGVIAAVGDQSLTVSWNSAQGVSAYILEYGPHGFAPGTGTQVYTQGLSYTIQNLQNGTEYDVYVWFDCNNDQQVTIEIPTMVSATPNNEIIMHAGTTVLYTCNAAIYDNGGPNGNYANSSNDTLIIYPSNSECVLSISGAYLTESISFDYIKIFNGVGVSGTLLTKVGGTGSLPVPLYSTDPTGALTIVFRSDGSVTRSGFEFQVACICSTYTIQDTICFGTHYHENGFDTTFTSPGVYSLYRIVSDGTLLEVALCMLPPTDVSISGRSYFCGEDNITLTANSAVSYLWSTGETSQSITVSELGSYRVTITDSRGCTSHAGHAIVPIEQFISAINIPDMCAGNQYPITGGYEENSDIEMYHTQSTLSVADTAFLPDGVPCEPHGCSYRSTLTFTDYDAGAEVRSSDDIYYVKINMEHSYIGDIYINITCPNGQKADIMRWAGNGSSSCSSLIPLSARGWQNGDNYSYAHFGQAYDYGANDKCDMTDPQNAPGIGWNYCWSNNVTQGYSYASDGALVYRSSNVHGGIVDSSNVAQGSQFYHPDQSFSSLIGCPLNGSWYIEVMDGFSIDNGYVFGWELALTEDFIINSDFNVSQIVPDTLWTTVTSDSSFTIAPPATLAEDTTILYALSFYDSDGCSFDTLVPVDVYTTRYQDIWETACERYTWNGVEYTTTPAVAPVHTYQSAAGCDSIVTLHLTVHHPQHQSVWVDTCATAYTWPANNQTYIRSGVYRRSHADANGCTQVDTLHLNLLSPIYTPPIPGTEQVQCASDITEPQQLPTITRCGEDVPMQLFDSVDNIMGGCGYYQYIYHYTIDDVVHTWKYTYYLHPPTFSVPSSVETTVQCLDDIVVPTPPVVINSCGDTVVPVAMPVSHHSDGCTGYVSYSWKYEDCEHHVRTWTYTFWVADTVAPVFTVPSDIGICQDAAGTFVADTVITGVPAQISDNCAPRQDLTVSCSDILAPSTANGTDTLYRTWIVTDPCNNVARAVQRIFLHPSRHSDVYEEICAEDIPYHFINGQIDTIITSVASPLTTYDFLFPTSYQCDSTVTLHLTVYYPLHADTTVVAFDQFLWNDSLYHESGDYTYSHLDANGCEQVDTLHLTVYYSSHTDVYDTACVDYFWYGTTYTASGQYDHLLQDAHGADSLLTLHLTILGGDTVEFYKEVCFSYTWENVVYDTDGDYTILLTNSRGCDSIVTMHLTIVDTLFTDFTVVACNFFIWEDEKFSVSGDYDHFYNVAEGCDSVATMHLTLYYDTAVTVSETACESYTWGNTTYTQSGRYSRHFTSEHGCDSAVTMILTINQPTSSYLVTSVCTSDFPFFWNGVRFEGPDTRQAVLVNAVGCDSIVTMVVHENPTTYATLYDTIVQNDLPYDTLGMHFTASGRLCDTIVNSKGCDSVVTMHLTVLPNVFVNLDSTICENDLPVYWNDRTFTQTGTQSDTLIASNKVDSVVIMHLYVHPNTYSVVHDTIIENNLPHTFQGQVFNDSITGERIVIPNAHGCDSIISYSLFVWRNVASSADTLICEQNLPFVWNGVVFTGTGDSTVLLVGAHGVDSLLRMQVQVSPSESREVDAEVCMSDFPYHYINGQIDTLIVSVASPFATYDFHLFTQVGCDSIVTLNLSVIDTSLKIVSTDDFCSGEHTVLTVESGLPDYVWSTGETTPSIRVSEPGIYSVTASQGDCEGRAFLRILPCRVDLRLPNAITPANSDGLNDVFSLPEEILPQIKTFEITIFNRWGNPVFYSDSKYFEWHGDYNGSPCDPGVYVYSLWYIDSDNTMQRKKGNITIL